VLRCVLLEIVLKAGSVVLEGAGGVLLRQDAAMQPAACSAWICAEYPGRTPSMLAHFMMHQYIAVVCK